jgi:hypothetical protein
MHASTMTVERFHLNAFRAEYGRWLYLARTLIGIVLVGSLAGSFALGCLNLRLFLVIGVFTLLAALQLLARLQDSSRLLMGWRLSYVTLQERGSAWRKQRDPKLTSYRIAVAQLDRIMRWRMPRWFISHGPFPTPGIRADRVVRSDRHPQ